ncbi:ABC transporter ATP-binding protein [Anaerococcus sp. AGMB09787]|uniref:ABC transporter ATP-binding protein n=1 Tax=Anaerococcus sp. AGMB09787 TaxID=2922869 RepID=UPI001FAFE208|nr:ABC transporter ATP-binding protein [Anaerococcus sp. AGMB09787]
MNDILRLEKVCKDLGGFKLQHLTFSIESGSIVGFIGENGAGKSTTIKLILEQMKRDGGEVYIFGKRIEDLDEEDKKKIGFVFDDLFLPQDMKLEEVEKFHRDLYGKSWDRNLFFDFCKRFALDKDSPIKLYSRGMKMKLSMALALSHNPYLLILDEATSGLDPIVRDDILDILFDFIQDENKGILISSHILSDLEKIADKIVFIHKGRMIFSEYKDRLEDEYGIVSLSDDNFESLNPKAVVGVRSHSFGKECLIRKDLTPESLDLKNASIEEIMIFMIKEKYDESIDL